MKKSKEKLTIGITNDDITKAERLLGLSDHISKGADEDEETEEDDEDEEEERAPKKKKKKEIKKSKKSLKKDMEGDEDYEDEDEEEEKESKKKKKKGIKKAVDNDLVKALDFIEAKNNKKFEAVGTLLQGMRQQLKKSAKIQKALQTDLAQVFDAPLARKSKVQAQERFIEKAQGDGKMLHIVKDKKRILDILDRATFEKGEKDMFWGNAMTSFQISNQLPKAVIDALRDDKGIVLIKG